MVLTARQAAVKHGYRSGLEETVAASLRDRHVPFTYEKLVLPWVEPETKHRYTPDFVLETRTGKTIIIETKGRWFRADRLKMLAVVKQHPDLDIRMVFQQPNARIAKGSKTTYAVWCQKKLGILWSKGDIPTSWILE